MSQYDYSPLSDANSIRLLRLMPHANERTEGANLQCELFEYSLRDLRQRTHLYEALSYTWGGEEKPSSITIDNHNLNVTTNLHTALLHLRHCSLDRIIWIDAICINQYDMAERAQQVQLMAVIYSKAHCVLVWLGEGTKDVEGALEYIQCAVNEEESFQRSSSKMNEKAIFSLLQRQWFQRIWVLQEVAAARHVVVICGSTEIDGYAFCLGLESLRESGKLSYTAFLELQSLPSLTNLIKRAGLRPKHTTTSLQRYSLGIRSLAELIDMFHTCQASDPRDKVYALLGMSTDDPKKADLQPDYNISWAELFQQLVGFILGKDVSVETFSQRATIKSKGCIFGQVSSVRRDDKQHVKILLSQSTGISRSRTEWTLQPSANPIQEHDIICFLHGAFKPTIIRLCKDHFAVVVIAATPLNRSGIFGWSKNYRSTTQLVRDILLVWDWEKPLGNSQDQEEYETLIKTHSQALEYEKAESGDYLDEAKTSWNDIMILDDLGEYENADERLLKARSGCMTAFKKEHSHRPDSQYGRTLVSFIVGEGHEDIIRRLLDILDLDLKDGKYGRTPLSWAAGNGHEVIVKLLLDTGKVDADAKDIYHWTPLSWAAGNGHEVIVKLLLGTGNVDVDAKDKEGRTPLLWAAENGHEVIVKLLLDTGKVDLNAKDTAFNRTPIMWAVTERQARVTILTNGKVDVHESESYYSRTLLSSAAENRHEAIVKLLLDTGKVDVNVRDVYGRTLLFLAIADKHEAVVRLLLDIGEVDVNTKDRAGWMPLSMATRSGQEAIVKLLLDTGKVDVTAKDPFGQTLLSSAIKDKHEAVAKLLLDTVKVDTDEKSKDGQTPFL